ncbi:MAG: AAA family ATPase [bacterium]|nr:AAA family ATPase [bacterium]
MEKNNTVYLLIGQRGSGKSHYARRIIENQPGLSAVSRDEILLRFFGSVDTNPYTGAQYLAQEIMHRLLRRKLSTQTGLRLILDAWTGESRERKLLISRLRQHGATRVVALYFITPLETVNSWFWKKPGIAKMKEMKIRQEKGLLFFSEDAPAHDYKIFHECASRIDSNGFDKVIRINPQKELVVLN